MLRSGLATRPSRFERALRRDRERARRARREALAHLQRLHDRALVGRDAQLPSARSRSRSISRRRRGGRREQIELATIGIWRRPPMSRSASGVIKGSRSWWRWVQNVRQTVGRNRTNDIRSGPSSGGPQALESPTESVNKGRRKV